MVEVSAEAARHLRDLRDYDEDKQRPAAARNLEWALARAIERIGRSPDTGRVAPGTYPSLRRDGMRWIKERRYWFAYLVTTPPVIVAVFFETANLPGRV